MESQDISFDLLLPIGCCRYRHCGVVAGKLFMLLVVIDYLLLLLLEWLVPEKVSS